MLSRPVNHRKRSDHHGHRYKGDLCRLTPEELKAHHGKHPKCKPGESTVHGAKGGRDRAEPINPASIHHP